MNKPAGRKPACGSSWGGDARARKGLATYSKLARIAMPSLILASETVTKLRRSVLT